jgi:hypothetical protein
VARSEDSTKICESTLECSLGGPLAYRYSSADKSQSMAWIKLNKQAQEPQPVLHP